MFIFNKFQLILSYNKSYFYHFPQLTIYFTKINECWHQREIIRRKNYIIQLPISASLIVYTTDWELHIIGNKSQRVITKQKNKYVMADKKLRIHWKLKIEQHQGRILLYVLGNTNTTKTPDWHELRCSIWVCSSNFTNITSWAKELGEIAPPPPPTLKSWGWQNSFPPFFSH
jgi:hypothetical protein